MTDRAPRPWRQDPETLERLGLDLDAERRSLREHDLEALKESVQTQIASGAAAGAGWSAWIGWASVLGLAGLITGAAVLLRTPGPPPAPAGPPPAVAPFQVREVRLTEEPRVPRSVEKHPAPAETHPTMAEAHPATAETHPAPAETHPTPLPAPAPASRTPEGTDLAAQLERYERGQAALTAREPARAAALFLAYLEAFPDGRLRVEAELGLLEAYVQGERYGDATRLAERLADDPLASHRRREILQVLGESRVMLGRCEEARAALVAADVSTVLLERALAKCPAQQSVAPK